MNTIAQMLRACIGIATAFSVACVAASAAAGDAAEHSQPVPAARAPGAVDPIHVAMLRYGTPAKSGQCFGTRFLQLAASESTIRVSPVLDAAALDGPALFEHPFAIMSGEGSFELSDRELAQLRRYLVGGGFLLATAGCSSNAWQGSFERAVERVFPDAPVPGPGATPIAAAPGAAPHPGARWVELPMTHEVFHTLFDIADLTTRPPGAAARILALEIDGRITCIYSPGGLNDTKSASGGEPAAPAAPGKATLPPSCCCCGTVEILSAPYLNANILAYAVMH